MIYAPQSSPSLRRLPACGALVWLLSAHALAAQEVREISTATRLRKEPQGTALVSLPAGTAVEPRRTQGNWHEVVIEGWIFTSSTQPTTRDGFDMVVTTSGGENIRLSPNGEVVGRVRSGTLLSREEVRGAWTRVRRAGWVPRDAFAAEPRSKSDTTPTPVTAPAQSVQPQQGQPAAPPGAVGSTRSQAEADRMEVSRETPLHMAPEGGQYGTLQAGAPARVLGRSGEWVRVQVEGWVRQSDLQAASGGALSGITAAEVRTDPPKYVGRTVDWRVELIAVQEADELRPEMPRGQKYLLTRGPLPEPGFVYVTVTDSQVAEFQALQALQEVTLRVVIKAPRTRFLATPVVELVSRVQ